MRWALGTCFPSFKPGTPPVTLPELDVVLAQQEEAAAQRRATALQQAPDRGGGWRRRRVCTGTAPVLERAPLLTPTQSPETEKWETRMENQMGAIYPGCSRERLPGKSD